MTVFDVLKLCHLRGVQLVIGGDELRARGPKGSVSDALRAGLAEHKAALIDLLGDGLFNDPTLPDSTRIPPDCPNTTAAIRVCLEGQKVRAA